MKHFFIVILMILVSSSLIYSQETSKGKFSGQMFGDYFYNVARDTSISAMSSAAAKSNNIANGGAKDMNAIQFRRISFNYDYEISEKFSTRFRLEADQVALTSDNKTAVFVKDAYLLWKNVFKGSDFIFGIQPTPSFEISDGIWGHRFLEKTILDLRGIVSSRDLGVSLKGKIDGAGMFKYWLMFGDNSGNGAEVDRAKRFYGHIQITPTKQLTATITADFKERSDVTDPGSTSTPKTTISNNDLTYAFFVSYREKDYFTLGFETILTGRQNGLIVAKDVKNLNGLGYSVFGSFNFSKELAVVARYDYYDPNTDADYKGDSRNWFLLGFDYKLDDKVTVTPNVIMETYEAIPNGKSFDASITPRITFHFTF